MEKLLIFNIQEDCFGIGLPQVVDVSQMVEITEVPRSPEFIEGMINLRGEVIYVLDLRKFFNYKSFSHSIYQKIIISNLHQKKIGLVVDSVDGIVDVPIKDITFPSSATPLASFLRGVVNYKERLIFILDMDKILTYEERAVLEKFQ